MPAMFGKMLVAIADDVHRLVVIIRRYFVADIYNVESRINAQQASLSGCRQVISGPNLGGKRDNGHGGLVKMETENRE